MKSYWTNRSVRAFSLIEMIGILAVIAVLASIVLPAMIRHIDVIVANHESAMLQSFDDAMVRSIMRNRYIPGAADWTSRIATELGMSISDVSTNIRHARRVFLIDPNLQVGTNNQGLPYMQTNWPFGSRVTSNGQIIPPTSPRVMILSSLSMNFPDTFVSGVPAPAGDFATIWNWDDTSSVKPGAAGLAAWGGKAEDLKVQRINLSPVFVHLLVSSYPASPNPKGYYSLDGGATNQAPASGGIEGYFIQDTVLSLYVNSGGTINSDSRQVLLRDGSFVCDAGMWRSSIYGDPMPIGIDFAGSMAQFLSASTIAADGGLSASNTALAMTLYVNDYMAWVAAGSKSGGPTHKAVIDAQIDMVSTVLGLLTNAQQVACP
jgi:Tfp pilus assembly protein PilE